MAGKEGKYYEQSEWENEIPHTIYFYWATPVGVVFDVRAYIWVNPGDHPIRPGRELDGLIGMLAANARKKGDAPRSIGDGFKVPWWKISYFVVAMDHTDEFVHNEALEFGHIGGPHNRPNHTFFDGWDGTLDEADGKKISVAWTVNHMKTRHGKNLGDGEVHRFKLGFKAKRRGLVDGGDSGTNMGPPIGPPP
jgi:hypothetical protein